MQGSAQLHAQLQARLARHMAAFERAALATSLHIPAGLLLPGPGLVQGSGSGSAPPADPAAEAAVDAELAALTAQLSQARARSL